MPVKIRLQRHGRSKRPFYHIVVADSRARRDGKFIDRIGDYNPLTTPATINLNFDKAFDWLQKGAQPTDTCRRILSYKGVMYKKHLDRGVRKGALTPEQAASKLEEWMTAKTTKIDTRKSKLNQAAAEARKSRLDAETNVKEQKLAARTKALEPEAPAAEATPETPEAPAAEETNAAE